MTNRIATIPATETTILPGVRVARQAYPTERGGCGVIADCAVVWMHGAQDVAAIEAAMRARFGGHWRIVPQTQWDAAGDGAGGTWYSAEIQPVRAPL